MFCWHKWSKWQEYTVKQDVIINPRLPLEYRQNVQDIIKTYDVKYQKRRCIKCGKTQRQEV